MINPRENVPLAPLTTLGVGGPARYFVEAESIEDVKGALEFGRENSLDIFVLGSGSNVLISDDGFDGLVILNKILGISKREEKGEIFVRVGAGENWDDFVHHVVEEDLAGVEMLSGIPGGVGAAPVQNIGAYGQEVANSVTEIVTIHLDTHSIKNLKKQEAGFDYRKSIFNTSEFGKHIILEVEFKLKKGGKPTILYQDLVKHFDGKSNPTLKEVRDAVLEIRARKGMVIHSKFESYQSVGSFFKNPIVSEDDFTRVKMIADTENVESDLSWFWVLPDGRVKIAAAKLMELSGFAKGYKDEEGLPAGALAKVGVSPKHALSLINLGGAKAGDIVALAKKIVMGVHEKFGLTLEPEALMVGFDNPPI